MKKIFGISLVAVMTVCSAHAARLTQRPTQISDIVRMMESNPEYVDIASDAIVVARATKAGLKPFNLNLKNTQNITTPTLPSNGGGKTNNNSDSPSIEQTDIKYDKNCNCMLPETPEDAREIKDNHPDWMQNETTKKVVKEKLNEGLQDLQKLIDKWSY